NRELLKHSRVLFVIWLTVRAALPHSQSAKRPKQSRPTQAWRNPDAARHKSLAERQIPLLVSGLPVASHAKRRKGRDLCGKLLRRPPRATLGDNPVRKTE